MNKVFKDYAIILGMVWLGCAVIFMFAFMFFVKPQLEQKRVLSKQIKEKKEEFERACDVLSEQTREEFEKELEKLKDTVGDYVTDKDGTANLTFDISMIATGQKLSSTSIQGRNNLRVEEIEGCKLIGESKIDVDFESDFNQFAQFLNLLERHDPIIFVDNFSIAKARANELKGRVTMDLSVLVQKRQGI